MEISYQGEEVKTKNEEPHHFIFQNLWKEFFITKLPCS